MGHREPDLDPRVRLPNKTRAGAPAPLNCRSLARQGALVMTNKIKITPLKPNEGLNGAPVNQT